MREKKINVDFRSYRILGACNPTLAHEALQIEDKVGTMLPCNVVVQDAGSHTTEVEAIDPVASMQAIDSQRLKQAAEEVRRRLKRVIETLRVPLSHAASVTAHITSRRIWPNSALRLRTGTQGSHGQPSHRFADRLGIGSIVLVAFLAISKPIVVICMSTAR
jgi:hypothetical protein